MYHQIMTTILWIHIHDVIHDVTKSQNRSNFEIDDQKLKMSEMPMAIFLVYSTSGITSGKKSLSRAQNVGHFENFEIWNTASIWPQIWKYRPKLCQKKYFHDDDVIDDVTGWPQSRPSLFLYIWNNNIFMITKQRAKISSLNFPCICIMRL